MKNFILLISLIFTYRLAHTTEIAVIVNKQNPSSDKLDETTIKRIFLGRLQSFPEDGKAVPVDQKGAVREYFYKKIADKNLSDMTKHWARLVFTGQGSKPEMLNNDSEVIKFIKNNPQAIGYINANSVNSDTQKVFLVSVP